MWEKPAQQVEIPYGIIALGGDLEERITKILVELKKRYDKEMVLAEPPQYGHLQWDPDLTDDHAACVREDHRHTATAHAHAYFLVAKTFKLTEREAWSLIKPYLEEGSKPPKTY
jgi:hypothetical protein